MNFNRCLLGAFAILSSLLSAHAQTNLPVTDPNYKVAPGTMGPNAFTNWMFRINDPVFDPTKITFEGRYWNVRDRFKSNTHTGMFRVEIPFSELSSLELNYLMESWKLGPEAMKQFQPRTQSGFSQGDLVATFKYRVFKETKTRPMVWIGGSLKTAPGSFDDRRFTNSTGYSISAIVAKQILFSTGALEKIRFVAELGFMAWDDGAHSQNDAVRFGASSIFQFKKSRFTAGYQSFKGWRGNGDYPGSIYAEFDKKVTPRFSAFGSLDIGVRKDSNPWMIGGGIRLRVTRPVKKNRSTPTIY